VRPLRCLTASEWRRGKREGGVQRHRFPILTRGFHFGQFGSQLGFFFDGARRDTSFSKHIKNVNYRERERLLPMML
jgi:hypothetical protein